MTYEGAADGKHYWLTPKEVYDKLDQEFHFDFDPCPYPQPEGFDGLKMPWGDCSYVNPPFKGPTKWVRKAIEGYQKGKKVVFVFPIDKWIHYLIEAGAEIRNLKDVRWCAIEDGKEGKGTGRWIACFILDPKNLKQVQKTICDDKLVEIADRYCQNCGSLLSVSGFCLNRACPIDTVVLKRGGIEK